MLISKYLFRQTDYYLSKICFISRSKFASTRGFVCARIPLVIFCHVTSVCFRRLLFFQIDWRLRKVIRQNSSINFYCIYTFIFMWHFCLLFLDITFSCVKVLLEILCNSILKEAPCNLKLSTNSYALCTCLVQ